MRARLAALLLLALTALVVPRSPAADPRISPLSPAAGFDRADEDDDDDKKKDDDEDEEPERLPQGLKLTFQALRDGAPSALPGDRDVRHARLIALRVPAGSAPTPFLKPGPFRATWEGSLTVNLPGEYAFSAACLGTVHATINGKAALDGTGDGRSPLNGKPVRLRSGHNALVVRFDSPPTGDAALRMSWSSEDFAPEPVPIASLGHDAKAADLLAGLALRTGRSLIAELRCLKCHQAPGLPAAGGMPDLDSDAPSLADAGSRLNPAWVAKWVEDPHALRADASMPRLVHGPTAPAAARDIAAYLATLGSPAADEPAPPVEEARAGGRLFANLGCIGCHALPTRIEGKAPTPGRVPLRNVSSKWRPAALRAFLLQPDRHYASIRMPNFHLSDAEAARLAAFVLAPAPAIPAPPAAPAADADRGKDLVRSSGCLNCHAIEGLSNEHRAPSLADLNWSRGCLASTADPASKAPDFALDVPRRAALNAFAADGRGSLARESAPELAERQVASLRCVACHRRDGADDLWTESKAEVDPLLADAPPEPDAHNFPALQARPQLTWVGEKLKPEWSAEFIAGSIPYKPRPYLRARMPSFARWAGPLAHGLALEHGVPTSTPPDAAPDPALAEVGKSLARAKDGLACVSCHQAGPAAIIGVFEAPGPNFMHVRARLLPAYYDRWIRSPIRVDPETKMPSFFNGTRSVLPGVLDGDAAKQAEALWNYLLQGESIQPPPT